MKDKIKYLGTPNKESISAVVAKLLWPSQLTQVFNMAKAVHFDLAKRTDFNW